MVRRGRQCNYRSYMLIIPGVKIEHPHARGCETKLKKETDHASSPPFPSCVNFYMLLSELTNYVIYMSLRS